MGPFGTYDQQGNVQEWVSNPTGDRRYLAGGAWNTLPFAAYGERDARDPFERPASFGFRCVRYVDSVPDSLRDAIPPGYGMTDRRSDKPVDDATFRIFRSFYDYDRTDLKATLDSAADSPSWRMEK